MSPWLDRQGDNRHHDLGRRPGYSILFTAGLADQFERYGVKSDQGAHLTAESPGCFHRPSDRPGSPEKFQALKQGGVLAAQDAARSMAHGQVFHSQGGFTVEKPCVPSLFDKDMDMGPEDFESRFSLAGLRGGSQDHQNFSGMGLHQFGEDLGFALEVIVEVTSADPHGRGDVHGRQPPGALVIEQVPGGLEDPVARFHLPQTPVDLALQPFSIGRQHAAGREGSGATGGDAMTKAGIRLDTGGATDNSGGLNPIVGVAREDLIGAVGVLLRETAGRPVKTLKHVAAFNGELVKIVTGRSELEPGPKDKRFADTAWRTNPLYKAGMQYYLAVQKGVAGWLDDVEFDELERARANFVTGMILDSLAPSNSLLGNPSAIKKAFETGGGSLLKGLKNAYDDLTQNDGIVSQVDKRPFKVGENLAVSPGSVIYRTEMMELIQYQPTTEAVHQTPLMIIPPQINKAYVNDLSPDKSMVRFLVSSGFQVFLVSWRNPTKEQAHWGLGDYVESLIDATDVVRSVTGSAKINVSGACSGGITTATLLSRLAAEKDDRIGAVSMMVCVLDPDATDSEAGALVSKHGIEMARQRSAKKGILEGASLSRTFAWLRPNDLVWNYVINNYLHGEDPPPFDVLFWNNDSTNLTATLHSDYLRVYEDQPFRNPGQVELAGHKVDLTKVTQDLFVVAGVTDHITPWKACYRLTQLIGSPKVDFVLSQAGHIQALLNPPGNPKAKYFHSATRPPPSIDDWMQKVAEEKAGSWWPFWKDWLAERSGPLKAPPKALGSKKHRPMEAAPGLYVFD